MSKKNKLPKVLCDEIKELSRKGYSSDMIFGMVIAKARNYVNSHEELSKCIASLIGSITREKKII